MGIGSGLVISATPLLICLRTGDCLFSTCVRCIFQSLGIVKTDLVARAMKSVDRKNYVPGIYRYIRFELRNEKLSIMRL